MKIVLGSDHKSFKTKKEIKNLLKELGEDCVDITPENRQNDYPDVAYEAAKAVSENKAERAILICDGGHGMAIAANKISGIRAVPCYNEFMALISRAYNDANVLCLNDDIGRQIIVKRILEVWLNTKFSGGRHQRRVNKIAAYEQGKYQPVQYSSVKKEEKQLVTAS